MTGLMRTATALLDELAAIACPVTRAMQAKTLARTFRSALATVYRTSLQQARDAGRPVSDLAASTAVTPGRIYQLTVTPRPATQESS